LLTIALGFRVGWDDGWVGFNFRGGDRDQLFLMPPSVAEWLPAGHLAWFVLDVVGQFDLSGFRERYRVDGRGGAAYDPAVMVAVLIYAYCVGDRSSRRVERRLVEDVAYRVVAANAQPDHATLARFRAEHEAAIEALFAQVLALCAAAGLIRVGVVALDGTKMEAAAAMAANMDEQRLLRAMRREARRILDEAAAVDAAEDEQFGDDRGDELPAELADRSRRLARLREAKARLDEMTAGASDDDSSGAEGVGEGGGGSPSGDQSGDEAGPGSVEGRCGNRPRSRAKERVNATDPDSRLLKRRGGFCQGYNAQAVATENQMIVAAKVGGHDAGEFVEMVDLARANLAAAGTGCPIEAVVADAGYYSTDNATHDAGVPVLIATRAGRHHDPTTNTPPDTDCDDDGDIDTDLDGDGDGDGDTDGDEGNDTDGDVDPVAEAERAEAQLTARRARVLQRVVDGELTISAAARELGLCWKTTRDLLERYRAGGVTGLVRKRRANGEGPRPDSHTVRDRRAKNKMNARLATPLGRQRYKKRSQIIEPVFGQIKDPRRIRRFQRRGHAACQSEWSLICATHNILKYWRATTTAPTATNPT
jgi:transposase